MWELKQMQALPLEAKIAKTQLRIREWVDTYGEDGVYISFSGGKDSTVLLDIVRKMYPNIEACFVNTGLEYPSVRKFALSKENVTELRPNMNFREVVSKYGYPIISKEVSGSVYEGKKYLDKLREYETALTDRQTDRRYRMLIA
jgi:3'-phosphoadenosine 5'-phosphosulfate sulfotransferase (PAPS reductase)/FAD synthetase